jgi:dynein light intermediate chain 2, cytosolic
VPVVIVGTKYDVFANQFEPQRKKIICRALRYFAHDSGASLVFTSVRENQSSQFKSLLLAQAFEVAGQPSETKIEVNPNMPIVVPAGQD